VQSVVLPTVHAQIELSQKNPERSIELLRTAAPYELTDASLKGCIYPAYVRGEAYLAAKQGTAAAAEFQKILDHRGLVGACETGALAHLGIARAYALQGRRRQSPRRVPGLPHALERRRSRCPHPEASESGVREVTVIAARKLKSKKCGATLAYMAAAALKAMEASAERAPRVYPNIYRGLTELKRVVRPEEMLEKVVHQEAAGTDGAKLLRDFTDRRPNDVEIAPGVFRY